MRRCSHPEGLGGSWSSDLGTAPRRSCMASHTRPASTGMIGEHSLVLAVNHTSSIHSTDELGHTHARARALSRKTTAHLATAVLAS